MNFEAYHVPRSASPVFDGKARDRGKVSVHRDDCSFPQSQGDGGDPDVILTDGPAELFELESDPC
jgi:hypothetical protein